MLFLSLLSHHVSFDQHHGRKEFSISRIGVGAGRHDAETKGATTTAGAAISRPGRTTHHSGNGTTAPRVPVQDE